MRKAVAQSGLFESHIKSETKWTSVSELELESVLLLTYASLSTIRNVSAKQLECTLKQLYQKVYQKYI